LSEDPRVRAKRLCQDHLKENGLTVDRLDTLYPGYYTWAAATRVDRFSTTWVVPDLPTDQVNRTFFIWNGADGGSLQPVLQWGNGTLAYQIANWAYVGGYFHGTYVPVAPGDVLTGIVKFVAGSGDKWTFKESFDGYPAADLTVVRPNDVSSVCQCFEAYTPDPTQWPANEYTAMTKINLVRREGAFPQSNFQWTISTTTTPPATKSGKTTVIVSESAVNGEIDFYFH
jgi:hypothetical protein